MPNGESALTRSAYAPSGRRSRPPDFVLAWHAPCVHPWRAITVPWMASHVLAYVSHGQGAGAVDAFARTVLFFVFGLDSCAHQRALPLMSVTSMTDRGFETWYAPSDKRPTIFTFPPDFVSLMRICVTPPESPRRSLYR